MGRSCASSSGGLPDTGRSISSPSPTGWPPLRGLARLAGPPDLKSINRGERRTDAVSGVHLPWLPRRGAATGEVATILASLACGHSGCPCAGAVRRGRGRTHCPTHEDPDPSLNVEAGDQVDVVVHCFAGCSPATVIGELRRRGLRVCGEGPSPRRTGSTPPVQAMTGKPETTVACARP